MKHKLTSQIRDGIDSQLCQSGKGNLQKSSTELEESQEITLAQLVSLRWLAILGQTATIGIVVAAGVNLALIPLTILILAMSVSNILVSPSDQHRGSKELTAIIIFDVVLLTGVLYWSGGAHNPFTSFYLLQAVIAALTLETVLAWIVTVLCICGFSLLFLSPHILLMPHARFGEITFNLHLQGMFVAFALTGRNRQASSSRSSRLVKSL